MSEKRNTKFGSCSASRVFWDLPHDPEFVTKLPENRTGSPTDRPATAGYRAESGGINVLVRSPANAVRTTICGDMFTRITLFLPKFASNAFAILPVQSAASAKVLHSSFRKTASRRASSWCSAASALIWSIAETNRLWSVGTGGSTPAPRQIAVCIGVIKDDQPGSKRSQYCERDCLFPREVGKDHRQQDRQEHHGHCDGEIESSHDTFFFEATAPTIAGVSAADSTASASDRDIA